MSRKEVHAEIEYDLNLRLWSNSIPLEPIASALDFPVKHLHVKGQKLGGSDKRSSDRISTRHYVSFASERVQTGREVETWLASTISRAEQTPSLRQPGIEIVFWIALIAREPKAALVPDPALVARVAALGAEILVENYSEEQVEGEGFPPKAWYPPRDRKIASAAMS